MKIIKEFYQEDKNMKTRQNLVEGGAKWLTEIFEGDTEHSVWVIASEAPFSSDCPFTFIFKRNEEGLFEVLGYDADWSLWIFDSNEDVYPDYVMFKWLNADMSFDEAAKLKSEQYKGCSFDQAYEILSQFASKCRKEFTYEFKQQQIETLWGFMNRVMAIIGELKTECFVCDGTRLCSNCKHHILTMDEIYYPKRESYNETLDMYLLGCK